MSALMLDVRSLQILTGLSHLNGDAARKLYDVLLSAAVERSKAREGLQSSTSEVPKARRNREEKAHVAKALEMFELLAIGVGEGRPEKLPIDLHSPSADIVDVGWRTVKAFRGDDRMADASRVLEATLTADGKRSDDQSAAKTRRDDAQRRFWIAGAALEHAWADGRLYVLLNSAPDSPARRALSSTDPQPVKPLPTVAPAETEVPAEPGSLKVV